MAEKEKVDIPEAPSGLPVPVARKWKAAYEASFREAQEDYQEDVVLQKQVALRDANRTLRFADPTNYEEAMKLEPWHCVLREPDGETGKILRVVTRHGKKFTFPIPASQQKAPEKPPTA